MKLLPELGNSLICSSDKHESASFLIQQNADFFQLQHCFKPVCAFARGQVSVLSGSLNWLKKIYDKKWTLRCLPPSETSLHFTSLSASRSTKVFRLNAAGLQGGKPGKKWKAVLVAERTPERCAFSPAALSAPRHKQHPDSNNKHTTQPRAKAPLQPQSQSCPGHVPALLMTQSPAHTALSEHTRTAKRLKTAPTTG